MKKISTLFLAMAFSVIAYAQIPTAGLMARWTFDNTIRDTTSNVHHLTSLAPGGTANYVQGMKGGAVSTGGGLYSNDMFLPAGPFTLCAWVKHSSNGVGTSFPTVIEMEQSLLMRFNANFSSVEGCFAYNTVPTYACTSSPITSDTMWHHYVGVHDPNNQMSYTFVDGVLVNSLAIGATLSVVGMTAAYPVMVGFGSGGTAVNTAKYLFSSVDELMVYQTNLDSNQVRAIWCDAMPVPAITNTANTLTVPPSFTNVQWSLNGSVITGANGNSYTATATGNYTATATYNFGCSKTSASESVTISSGTGINAIKNVSIEIYPNPATESITINTSVTNPTVKILSITGSELISENLVNSKSTIDISSLAAGVYLLEVNTKEGVSHHKIVKK